MYIVLSDIYVKGHHLTFIQQYALSLLKQNKKIVLLFPQPHLIVDFLKQNHSINHNDIITEVITEPTLKIKLHPLFYYFLLALKRWIQLGSTIYKIQKKHNLKIDYVFIMWLDSYLYKYFPKWLLSLVFKYKWSGIYFHPNYLRKSKNILQKKTNFFKIDNILKHKQCKAVGVLDFFLNDVLCNRIGKPVINFPDITNVDFDKSHKNEIAEIIAQRKLNKTVVGFIGIEPRKNIINLINCINKYDLNDYLFVIIGEFNLSVFEKKDAEILKNFIENTPSNCLYKNQYIKDGFDYNAIFNQFDIAWACYINFYTASNILVKASYFKKPVLGSTQNYIEDAIKKYNLGICANPKDIDMIYKALLKLKENSHSTNYNFDLFFEKHNSKALDRAFEKLNLL